MTGGGRHTPPVRSRHHSMLVTSPLCLSLSSDRQVSLPFTVLSTSQTFKFRDQCFSKTRITYPTPTLTITSGCLAGQPRPSRYTTFPVLLLSSPLLSIDVTCHDPPPSVYGRHLSRSPRLLLTSPVTIPPPPYNLNSLSGGQTDTRPRASVV